VEKLENAWRHSLFELIYLFPQTSLKEYRKVFRAGLRDPCTRDVARLSESVKILEPQASVFLRFAKVDQHPKCMDHARAFFKDFPVGGHFLKRDLSVR
jgi:hypothetical protein